MLVELLEVLDEILDPLSVEKLFRISKKAFLSAETESLQTQHTPFE